MKFVHSGFFGLALAIGTASVALAQTEIQWWHAMSGANNEVVDTLAKEFNKSQSDYKVLPVYKGTYPEALNAGIAAFRAGQPPHILQVFDVGTGVMMNAEGAIKPVAEVIEAGGQTFDKSQYLPGIVAYYSRPDGTMLSFPYNSSSPILYYNKDIYEKAGSTRMRRRRPGKKSGNMPGRSTRRVRQPVGTPRPGSPGSISRILRPGTICNIRLRRTALPAPTSS